MSNSDYPKRKNMRLMGYDYSQAGAYFITLCAKDQALIFGDVVNNEMRLNAIGEIVAEEWTRTGVIRPGVNLLEWVVMPNHFHAIVMVGPNYRVPHQNITAATQMLSRPKRSLGSLVAGFKQATTKRINELHQVSGCKVWQRNYYDHIIRGDSDYRRIAEYILNNPARWVVDRFYPNPKE